MIIDTHKHTHTHIEKLFPRRIRANRVLYKKKLFVCRDYWLCHARHLYCYARTNAKQEQHNAAATPCSPNGWMVFRSDLHTFRAAFGQHRCDLRRSPSRTRTKKCIPPSDMMITFGFVGQNGRGERDARTAMSHSMRNFYCPRERVPERRRRHRLAIVPMAGLLQLKATIYMYVSNTNTTIRHAFADAAHARMWFASALCFVPTTVGARLTENQ